MTLTFVRTAEFRMMEWDEIHSESKEWHIPPHKIKMELMHIVALSSQALELLDSLKPLTGNKLYVFYNHSTTKSLSSNALLCAIRTLGYVGKLYRSLLIGIMILHKQGYMHDSIDIQVAHGVGCSIVSQGYNHT